MRAVERCQLVDGQTVQQGEPQQRALTGGQGANGAAKRLAKLHLLVEAQHPRFPPAGVRQGGQRSVGDVG